MDVVIATNYDDWEGIYVDGELRYEGHKIPRKVLLEILNEKVGEIDASDYLEEWGNLPDDLTDLLKFEI